MSRTHTHCLVQITKVYFNENENSHTVKAARLGSFIAEEYKTTDKCTRYIPALYLNMKDASTPEAREKLIQNLFSIIKCPEGCFPTDFAFDYRVLPIEQSGAVYLDGYNGWMGYCNIKNP